MGSAVESVASVVSPVLNVFAPKPKKPGDPDVIDIKEEEDARNMAAQEEAQRRKKARIARQFTGPGGALVPDQNVGKARLLGQ